MADNQVEHHVKFNIQEEEFKNHHENLEITKVSDYEYNINVGYLKVDHYYKLKFSLDLSHLLNQESASLNYLVHKSSRHLSFKDIKLDESGNYLFSLIFHAFKEKHDIEKAYFGLVNAEQPDQNGHHSSQSLNSNGSEHRDDSDEKKLLINFEARVLGAHQGSFVFLFNLFSFQYFIFLFLL
jgi:hypothetical protein